MIRFGELICDNRLVLIDFFLDKQYSDMDIGILREVVADLGNQAKVVRMDVDQNKSLIRMLQICECPTFIIYKNGVMKWRRAGKLDANKLIQQIKEYI